MNKRDTPEYEFIWRNKWLTVEAKTLPEMVAALRGAANELETMQIAGVALDPESDIQGDYARLVTTDPAVAEKHSFELSDPDAPYEPDESETGVEA